MSPVDLSEWVSHEIRSDIDTSAQHLDTTGASLFDLVFDGASLRRNTLTIWKMNSKITIYIYTQTDSVFSIFSKNKKLKTKCFWEYKKACKKFRDTAAFPFNCCCLRKDIDQRIKIETEKAFSFTQAAGHTISPYRKWTTPAKEISPQKYLANELLLLLLCLFLHSCVAVGLKNRTELLATRPHKNCQWQC